MRIILLLGLMINLHKMCIAQSNFEKARDYANEAGDIGNIEKNYEKAIRFLDTAISLNPTASRYYFDRGDYEFKLQMFTLALKDFQKCVDLDPNHMLVSEHYFMLAKVKQHLFDYTGAILAYDKSLNNDPGYQSFLKKTQIGLGYFFYSGTAEVFAQKATCKEMILNYDGAITDYSMAIKFEEASILDPENKNPNKSSLALYYYKRGMVLVKKNNTKGCLDLERSYELGNKNALTAIRLYCNS